MCVPSRRRLCPGAWCGRLRCNARMNKRLILRLAWWPWLAAMLMCIAWLPAHAQGVLRDQGYWLDASASAGIDEAAAQEYAPWTGVLSRGYTTDALWLRLRLAPSPQAVQLRIRPTFLDDVRLFWRDEAMAWQQAQSGDAYPLVAAERVGPALGFRLPASAQARTVYLRVSSSSSMMVNVQALTPGEAVRAEWRMAAWQVMYAGFMLWLLFWALQDGWLTRNPVSLSFMGYQSVNLVYAVLVLGYGPWLSPATWGAWADHGLSWAVLLSSLTGLVFHRSVFVAFGAGPWLRRALWLPVAYSGVLALSFAWGHEQASLAANAWLVLGAGPALFALAWLLDARATPLVRTLRWVYAIQLASVLLSMLPLLGLADSVEWALYAGMLHGFIAALSMFFILSQRSQQQLRTAEQLREQSALAMQELRLQRAHNEEQARFVDMLTHELKTPVAVALMSLEGASGVAAAALSRTRRALASINGIVERARWSEMASQSRLQAQWEVVSVNDVVVDAVDATLAPERIELSLDQDVDLRSDRQLLLVVLSNLLDNALKYSPPQATIEVRVVSSDGDLSISVRNPVGVAGVPDAQRIFSKYYRQPAASGISGSGLGLYLAKALVELLGGDLHWHTDGQHVEFTCRFPL